MHSNLIDSFVQATGITPVMGYLDPGLGSMIVCAVVGVFATVSLAIKGFWYKIISPFRKKEKTPSDER